MSYRAAYNTTVEQFAEGNKDYITNATTIIDGIRLEYKMRSLINVGEIDRIDLIKLTHVLRSDFLKTGDTIVVLFGNVGYGNDSMYQSYGQSYPSIYSENLVDRSAYCEWFLKEFDGKIDLNRLNWGNKKVYEFYKSKYGFATVYFKDKGFTEAPYDVYALFNLKFKTRQEWYNYLKKQDNIKVPEGY